MHQVSVIVVRFSSLMKIMLITVPFTQGTKQKANVVDIRITLNQTWKSLLNILIFTKQDPFINNLHTSINTFNRNLATVWKDPGKLCFTLVLNTKQTLCDSIIFWSTMISASIYTLTMFSFSFFLLDQNYWYSNYSNMYTWAHLQNPPPHKHTQ